MILLNNSSETSFHQISHWSYCLNVIESLFNSSCSIDFPALIFFFKTSNCLNDDPFISCNDRIGKKMLHNNCISAVAVSLRWANRGPWTSYSYFCSKHRLWVLVRTASTTFYYIKVGFKGVKIIITETRLFKYIENFTTKNWKFSHKKNLIFFIFLLKT